MSDVETLEERREARSLTKGQTYDFFYEVIKDVEVHGVPLCKGSKLHIVDSNYPLGRPEVRIETHGLAIGWVNDKWLDAYTIEHKVATV